MKYTEKKSYIVLGILFLIISLWNFLEESPSLLPNSIVGLLFLFFGISNNKYTFLDKKSYIGLLGLIIYIGLLLTWAYEFKPSFVNDMNFYISIPFFILLVIWTPYIYKRAKKYEKTVEPYEKALKVDPEDVAAWNNKGSVLAEFKAYTDAVRCFDKVLEIDPKNARAIYGEGNALAKIKVYQTAVEYYDNALELDPKNANIWYDKGNALQELGKSQEAVESYNKTLELDPDFKLSKKALKIMPEN